MWGGDVDCGEVVMMMVRAVAVVVVVVGEGWLRVSGGGGSTLQAPAIQS